MANPSMKDVAARAGVSTKTVSNVVRGWPHVTPETRARVESALDELGYRMNLSARTLRSGRSGLIALAVPWLSSPYFAELTSEVVRVAEDRGWTVVVDQTGGLAERELRVVRGLRGQLIDGLIYSPYALGAQEIALHDPGTPIVLLGERVGAGVADHVAIDNIAAAADVVGHLAASGRRRIGAIGLQDDSSGENARLRARGYALALRAAGRTVEPALQQPVAAFERAEGAAAMDRMLDGGGAPDAVFCFSDLLALGAMHALHRRGLRVPDDVAVAGFDDIEDGRYAHPPLTTIRPDKLAIATTAVDFLLSRVGDGEQPPPRESTPGYELVVRSST